MHRAPTNRFLLGPAIALLATACTHADVYHVDNTCASSGSGVAESCGPDGPFRSIAEAMGARLAPGGRILVRATATPYDEPRIATTAAGSAAEPITLTSLDGGRPVWSGGDDHRLVVDHGHWVFENIVFDGAGGQSDMIRVRAPGVTFRDCELRDSSGDGFSVGGAADGLTVDRCHLHDLGAGGDRHAIVTGKEKDPPDYELTGLTVTNNRFENIGGDGIQLYEESGSCRKATVTGRIEGNTFALGNREGHENAVDIKATARADDPMLVARNTITGWDGSSTLTGSKPVVIQHCAEHIHFVENFVDRGGGNGPCSPCMGVIVSASTASAERPVEGIRIVGNVFVGQKRAIHLGGGEPDNALSGVEVLHNTAYGMARTMFRIEGPVGGSFRNNLVQGKVLACSGAGDLTGVESSHNGWFGSESDRDSCAASCGDLCDATDTRGSDAGLTDPASGDFTLRPESRATGAGVDVGLPYAGKAPDLGANLRAADPARRPAPGP